MNVTFLNQFNWHIKIQFLVEIILNKIKTPQSFFLAKKRDKLWLQKAATCIESAKMHKNKVCVPL